MEKSIHYEADLHVAQNAAGVRVPTKSECECAAVAAKRKSCPTSSPKRPRADMSKDQLQQGREPRKTLRADTCAGMQSVLAEKSVGLAEVLACRDLRRGMSEEAFFTYRLEHRSSISPSLAMHPGEERILIFMSDRPGIAAKIIFSALAVSSASANGDEEIEAKIHVLEVKESHRGNDLGGLLFVETMQALCRRFAGRMIRCQLDAEEDVTRHGKLVGLYARLGCFVKPNTKVQYLNNVHNEGETYRKVPMVILLQPAKMPMPCPTALDLSLSCTFLPVRGLLSEDGTDVSLRDPSSDAERGNRKLKWILVDDGNGSFQFRTTCGCHLFASSSGEVHVGKGHCGDPVVFNFSNAFEFSSDAYVVSDSEESDDLSTCSLGHEGSSLSSLVPPDEMWLIQTTASDHPEQRRSLTTDPCTRSLFLSPRPTPWRVCKEDRSFTCLAKQSKKRVQCRNSWRYQTVTNVNAWRCKYLNFNLSKMSIKDALNLVSSIPLNPSSCNNSSSRSISLRTFCYYAAEQLRRDGCPDWLVFVALIHELGHCVRLIEKREKIGEDESNNVDNYMYDYDWTASCRSQIVGCSRPKQASPLHEEFRMLCPEEKDPLCNTILGIYEEGCGLSDVLMHWSGPEYMYWMLRHNGAMLPELALKCIRFFALLDWHSRGRYSDLTNTSDDMDRDFISDFDKARRVARRECEKYALELSDSECERLWHRYYCNIAAKYDCNGDLSW
jgi:inositol oxygenase